MLTRRGRHVAALLVLAIAATASIVAPAVAAEEAGPPEPEAAVTTRTCEQNGAIVVMNNFGGGSVTFNVLADNEASGTYTVSAGSQANHLVPIMEDQTVALQVTADGMAPVSATRTRDCEGAAPAAADTVVGATDPVDEVPAGTPPPAEPVAPVAVAGAAQGPTAAGADTTDATTAPASDPAAPTGTLPFTGPPALGWLALAGVLLIGAGGAMQRAVTARAAAHPLRP